MRCSSNLTIHCVIMKVNKNLMFIIKIIFPLKVCRHPLFLLDKHATINLPDSRGYICGLSPFDIYLCKHAVHSARILGGECISFF